MNSNGFVISDAKNGYEYRMAVMKTDSMLSAEMRPAFYEYCSPSDIPRNERLEISLDYIRDGRFVGSVSC